MASIKPSLQGLNAALLPNVDDPLGTNIKRRGMDAYYEEAHKSDPNYMSGPLPDPQWAGMFQALADQGVTKVGQDADRPHGLADDISWRHSGDAGALRQSPLDGGPLMQSTNIATPVSLRGLQKAKR
jgi:hypothetical protein